MTNLHVEKIGKGRPFLLLHGWGKDHLDLKNLGTLISSHAEIYLVDLPGFGKSETPSEPWDSFKYADRLIAFLDENQIEQCDLLGHSFGGKVAMSLASRYPERLRFLFLLAASGIKRKRSLKEQIKMKALRTSVSFVKLFDKIFKTQIFQNRFSVRFGSEDYKKARGVMRSILVKSVNEDIEVHLQNIKAPTLILWGEEDTETPPEIAFRLEKQIKNSKLILFPHKNHYLHEDSGAHLCCYHIESFLREQGCESN